MLTEDYINRFGGVGRLYGKAALEKFCATHVMIVGLGGVGSWTVEALARSGIGKLTLVDLDDICVTNTNRQLPAHQGKYGQMKAEALAERVKSINPDCDVQILLAFYSQRNSDEILDHSPDIVVDAIDTVRAKSHLLAECRKRGIPVCSCGGAGGRMDATQVTVSDLSKAHGDRLISSVRNELRKKYGYPTGAGKKPKKFGIPTVFSSEEMTTPQACMMGGEELDMPKNLNCATGYGATTHVTATFGLVLAQVILDQLR